MGGTDATRRAITASLVLVCSLTFAFSQNSAPETPGLKLNQIQIIGTHNSYHAGPTPEESALIRKSDPIEADGLDYRHQSLTKQLDAGMRMLEIDIHADPKGRRFEHSEIQDKLANAGIADAPWPYPTSIMSKPGFKVMHKPRTDFRSNCQPFTACLSEIRRWSEQHKEDVPLYMFIEAKDGPKLTPADCDELDREILSVFSRNELFLPEDLLGNHTTLREAIKSDGWPEVDQVRGKLIFLMSRADVTSVYEAGYPGLKGRVLFTNGPLDDTNSAYTQVSEPNIEKIQKLVRDGLLVYTRADADTAEGRSGDVTRRETAIASGAQLISTDYPPSEPARWSGYTAFFPNHAVARCNPVNTHPPCSVAEAPEPFSKP
jgi:hypothetical protein